MLEAFPPEVQYERIKLPHKRANLRSILKNLQFARAKHGTICHITGDTHYLALATGRHTVLTIHDAYSVVHGTAARKLLIKLLWFWLPALAARRITTISEKSKQELEQIIPFAKNKIRVVPNPYNPRLLQYDAGRHGHTRSGLDHKPVVLHIGTKPNKNLERTIEALSGIDCRLLVLGELREAQAQLLARHQIDFQSFYNLPYDEVASLYHRCTLVSFASLYEGFGMPIIEAQLVGKPVVTSDIDPMNWVAGGAACLVNPHDKRAIRAGIQKVIADAGYRTDLIRKGHENVKRFEPSYIANMYVDVYKELKAGD